MSTYVVGDLQGCLDPLLCLLKDVDFNTATDNLWVVGDIVNRGPQSLDTLRYIYSMGDCAQIVLGNHDLNLLAVAEGIRKEHSSDTLSDILNAPDRDILLQWLRQQPLIHRNLDLNATMVHAGIAPQWSLQKAATLAREVEHALQSADYRNFLNDMYGNEPACWSDELVGTTRLKVITNYLTRMRFCRPDGALDLISKTDQSELGDAYEPWFTHNGQWRDDGLLLFGHWAALDGDCGIENIHALDTGCVWGRKLTMLRIEDRALFSCRCA